MRYTSRCTIGFMVVLLTSCFGCNSEERIEYHLQTLNDINSNISTGHWRVFYGFYQSFLADGWLSGQQKQYFELHKDSLTRVRGNEVASLPEAE